MERTTEPVAAAGSPDAVGIVSVPACTSGAVAADTELAASQKAEKRMAWSSEQLSDLFSTFWEDIESNNITLSSVHEKMKVMKHSVLSSLDERKIYDRL